MWGGGTREQCGSNKEPQLVPLAGEGRWRGRVVWAQGRVHRFPPLRSLKNLTTGPIWLVTGWWRGGKSSVGATKSAPGFFSH